GSSSAAGGAAAGTTLGVTKAPSAPGATGAAAPSGAGSSASPLVRSSPGRSSGDGGASSSIQSSSVVLTGWVSSSLMALSSHGYPGSTRHPVPLISGRSQHRHPVPDPDGV